MSLTYTTITETFEDGSGNPVTGLVVTFVPSAAVYASGSMVASSSAPIVASVNSSGQLKAPNGTSPLQLLATDNSGLSFESMTGFFYWTVTVASSGSSQSFSFFLPSSPSTVELYSLADTAAGGGGGGLSDLDGGSAVVTNIPVSDIDGGDA